MNVKRVSRYKIDTKDLENQRKNKSHVVRRVVHELKICGVEIIVAADVVSGMTDKMAVAVVAVVAGMVADDGKVDAVGKEMNRMMCGNYSRLI